MYNFVGRGSSVGIATRYGLYGPGKESWWDWHFPHPVQPNQPPYTVDTGIGVTCGGGGGRADAPLDIFSTYG
jgi:hypothetical protein